MFSDSVAAEADRILRICAACMYCDGLCPVFPALAGKHGFAPADIGYLANLCHNCRGCWYACQYAPPHAFAVNVPATLATARLQSYAEHVFPRRMGIAFRRPLYGAAFAALAALLSASAIARFATRTDNGALSAGAPWAFLAGLAAVLFVWAVVGMIVSTWRYWRVIAPDVPGIILARALAPAARDIVTLRHLDGGGAGCNDADSRFSRTRRVLHHLMAAGVLLDFAATATAAFYQEALGALPPYAYASLPVGLGAGGGAAILVGAGGLLAQQARADREPSHRSEARLNAVFLTMLAIVAASGLALLGWRETGTMGALLALHFGAVAGLFAALPASKMLHAPYRAAALLRYAVERLQRKARVDNSDIFADAE